MNAIEHRPPAGHEIDTQRLMFGFFWWGGVWLDGEAATQLPPPLPSTVTTGPPLTC